MTRSIPPKTKTESRARAKLRFCGFPVHSPTVLLTESTDKVSFKIDCPTAWPSCQYDTFLNIETEHDQAIFWLEKVLGILDYDITNIRRKK